jgi:hypothetical protein
MSNIAEAQSLIRAVFPASSYGSVQAACWAAYRRLKLSTERRAQTIWQGKARRIDSWELDALRYEKAKQDEAEAILQLKSTASFLANVDPEFYGPTIDQLRNVAGGLCAGRESSNETDE